MTFHAEDGLEDVIAEAMLPHRHLSKEPCEECAGRIARAVRAKMPAPWPPPRPSIDLTRASVRR